jgi:nucleotide-binding universal stress UspA family protein
MSMAGPQSEWSPRIVVGVDGSSSSLEALRWAVRAARIAGGSVDAVTAWEYPAGVGGFGWSPGAAFESGADMASTASDTLRTAVGAVMGQEEGGVTIRSHVREGYPARVLMDMADGADLLVVGCRGHGGFAGLLLGSVSAHCVHHAPCSVLVIRGEPRH